MIPACAFTSDPADGRAMTLDDFVAFVMEARERNLPGSTYIRVLGAIDAASLVGMGMHGPRCLRLTAVPGEEASR